MRIFLNFITNEMIIQFTSDYCEGAHPYILEQLLKTNMDQTVGYGVDEFCQKARNTIISRVCPDRESDPDVHFLVGGTQANITVISSALKPYQGVICAASGHINVHETGALEHSGHKALALPHTNGKISAEQIDTCIAEHYADTNFEHTVQPGMVYISFPTELGTLYSADELKAISGVCRKWDIPLFVDGARLGYGLAASDSVTLPFLASCADVFYIGGTKQGALFGEAVVIMNDKLKKDFRYNIKQNGGMLAKGRLLGIQFEALLGTDLYESTSYHALMMAKKIRAAFAKKGCKFLVDSPTNQQFPILPDSVLPELEKQFGFEIWQKVDAEHTGVRFCTSWATKEENVEKLLSVVEKLEL